jgi:ParB family chromosome partitioning protein
LSEARSSGRMVISVPLALIRRDHLVRDRVAVDEEEMSALIESLRARGQQTPVDLVDIGSDIEGVRYGLISGWRRCLALERLYEATGEARFGEVLGLVRQPQDTSDAYVAMVEENEIRVGLSYYERARIALRAVETGAFDSETAALRGLFASASRAKRSKIKSFTTIVRHLEGALCFPRALGERQGLALAQALEADSGLGARLGAVLRGKSSETPEAELALIRQGMVGGKVPASKTERGPLSQRSDSTPVRIERRAEGEVVLTGAGIDAAFLADLEGWLSRRC